jgi:O-6-methylguanine DNA methyltransferase
MKSIHIRTTWGTIRLTLNADGKAVELALPPLKKAPRKPFAFLEGFSDFPALEKTFRPSEVLPGTAFQTAVWRELKKIPRGQTRTYGEIAAAIGRPTAVRAVGAACGANPLPVLIPCHRVVAKTGIGGFSGGLPWKRLLLELEALD